MTMYYTYLKGNHRRYFIETDAGKPVAWFDDLDTAAIVLRYLKGAYLNREETERAHLAMMNFDRKEGKDHDTEPTAGIASPTDTTE